MVLSHELAHIVLGHNLGQQVRLQRPDAVSDESTYSNLGFKHIPEEEAAADKKALDLLQHSPYSQKLDSPGLFLKQLAERAPEFDRAAHGASWETTLPISPGSLERMVALMNQAPALDQNKLDQIAALPLGGRVRVNSWNNKVEMIKTAPGRDHLARDKLPTGVTPFFPRLTRINSTTTHHRRN